MRAHLRLLSLPLRAGLLIAAGVVPFAALAEEITVTVPAPAASPAQDTPAPAAKRLPEIVVPTEADPPAAPKAKAKAPADQKAPKKGETKSAAIKPDEKGGTGKVKGSGGQSIAVIVNDEPITGYEI